MTANDSLMELLFMIDAAVGASAHRVIAVTPWFGYSRQDKKSAPREPISARLVARMIEAAGADRVLTMDLHAGQIQGFFQKPVDHMTALFMLTQYFGDLGLSDLVVVAPDAGRVKLNKKFASKIGAELAILDKERPAQQVAEIGYVIGDVKGKTAVIVDDMIDTAGTLKAAARTVLDAGAKSVYAAATHAVFSGDAFENLAASGLKEIVVTDTIPARPGLPDEHPRAPLRGAAHRLDPPHLHRRLRQRSVRRREPAVLSGEQAAPDSPTAAGTPALVGQETAGGPRGRSAPVCRLAPDPLGLDRARVVLFFAISGCWHASSRPKTSNATTSSPCSTPRSVGDAKAMLAQLSGCAAAPKCVAAVRRRGLSAPQWLGQDPRSDL